MLCKNRSYLYCEADVLRLLRTLGMKAPVGWDELAGGLMFVRNEDS